MRIIAGTLRGRPIPPPPSPGVRPTASRTREAVFNMLVHHAALRAFGREGVQGQKILDMCCGSGAMGLEALSRGAESVTFVDAKGDILKHVQQTATHFGVQGQCHFLRSEAHHLPQAATQHGIVLFDPPYGEGIVPLCLADLHAKKWLEPGAVVVAEYGEREQVSPPEHYHILDERRYGAAHILLLRYDAY